jgi:3',5'-cyclic-nucleotide phosphodiesterase
MIDDRQFREIRIQAHRFGVVAKAVGTWQFSAHEFTDDELMHGALLMLEHALTMPDVERWRIPTGKWSMTRRIPFMHQVMRRPDG